MKIIVGLGNPGKKYALNRHNVGFMFIDYLLESQLIPNSKIPHFAKAPRGRQISNNSQIPNFKLNKKLKAEIAKIKINNKEILLVKPQTFMNESGKAVSKVINYYTSRSTFHVPRDLIIIHDDLDIRLGEYKIQTNKGPKLHNGLESIEKQLGTKEFLRIRIGVDNRSQENRIPGEAYVLQDFILKVAYLLKIKDALYGLL